MSYDRTLEGKDKMSDDELENPVKIEVESLSCCQCGSVIGQDEDIFDCDTCLNSSCASCRSKDRLGCLLCNKANDAGVKTEQSKEETPDDILKYYTKKKLHTNHIQDVRGIEHMSEDEINDPINGEVLSLSCRQCCQCGSVIGRDEEVFDSDTCEHSTCVSCRFNDRLACLLCKADVRTEETKEETPDDIWKHYKKKKLNIDHIVDVRDIGEQSVDVPSRQLTATSTSRTDTPIVADSIGGTSTAVASGLSFLNKKTTSKKVLRYAEDFHKKRMEYLKAKHELKIKVLEEERSYWVIMKQNALQHSLAPLSFPLSMDIEPRDTLEQTNVKLLSESLTQ